MPLDPDRLAALDLQTEGLRYAKTNNSPYAMKAMPSTPMPRTSGRELSKEAEEVAKGFEKLAADLTSLSNKGEMIHDKMYNCGLDLSDVPQRPQLPGGGYAAAEDAKNALIALAGWYRVTSSKLKEAPKHSDKK